MLIEEESNESIGHRLEVTRTVLHIASQAAMAAQLKAHPGKWNHYVRGRHRIAHELALEMCHRWGLTTDWIYRGMTTGLNPDLAMRLAEAADTLASKMNSPRPGRPKKSPPPSALL